MSTSYMKKVRDFWSGDEICIGGKWERVQSVSITRSVGREEVQIALGYGGSRRLTFRDSDKRLRYRRGLDDV